MKKIIAVILSLTLLAVGVIVWSLATVGKGQFQPEPQADFYLVYSGHIDSYELTGEKPNLLQSQKLPSQDYLGFGTNYCLENRYLVFANDHQKFTPNYLISLDFDSGKILRQPSKYSTYITGADEDSLYTAGAYGSLAEFNKELKLQDKTALPENFIPDPHILVTDDKIYIKGFENTIPSKNVLLAIDKKDPSQTQSFYYQQEFNLHEGALLNQTIYLPVFSTSQAESDTGTPSNLLLTFDTQTESFGQIVLEQTSPTRVSLLGKGPHLLIEHDGYTTQDIRFTIYNTETKEESLHVFPYTPSDYLTISHLEALDDERLLFIVGDQLYLYNWKTKKILSQTTLASDYLSGIWVTK